MVTIYGMEVKILHNGEFVDGIIPVDDALSDQFVFEFPNSNYRFIIDWDIIGDIRKYRMECKQKRSHIPKKIVLYKNIFDKWEIVKDQYWFPHLEE